MGIEEVLEGKTWEFENSDRRHCQHVGVYNLRKIVFLKPRNEESKKK